MTILVTGGAGQLATALAEVATFPACNSRRIGSAMNVGAVAGGIPIPPRVIEPVGEQGHPPVFPSSPDSRLGGAGQGSACAAGGKPAEGVRRARFCKVGIRWKA